jgi:SAM-dependent methyltransferase
MMKPKEIEALFYDWEFTQLLDEQNRDLELLTSLVTEAKGPVLELGCGSGRVTLHLAEAGVQVVGVDHSRPMLECLRKKLERVDTATASRVRLIEANMAGFDIGEQFSFIIAPYNVLCYLLHPDELNNCLRAVRSHLKPGGRFFCQVSDIGRDKVATEWELLAVNDLLVVGGEAEAAMYERISLEGERARIVNFHERYVLSYLDGHQEQHEFTLRMRSVRYPEMELAFAHEGFRVIAAYGDLNLSPLNPENADTQIYVAEAVSRELL